MSDLRGLRGRAALGVPALLAAALLAACAEPPEPIDRATAEAVLADNMASADQVQQALDRVARLCVEHLGFTVHPLAAEYEPDPGLDDLLGPWVYSAPDPSLPPGEIYGLRVDNPNITLMYEGDDGEDVHTEPDPFSELPQADRDAYNEAYYGSPGMEAEIVLLPDVGESERAGGGCMREAEDALADGAYPDYLNHAGLAGARGGTDWERDDRVAEARAAWSDCMNERGYDFEEPMHLRDALFSRSGDLKAAWQIEQSMSLEEAEAALAEEVLAAAGDDAACHAETGLEDVQVEVFWEYLIRYVSGHEEAFYSFHRRAEDMQARAQEILADGLL
ncbi:hypothetical protein O1R50_07290 [Glycomyces luteolus]|uniref:Uncharacterized protein n=1 Tax=Glycomyces luteolus TaxID=2670330 RepID=A0A9X3P5Y9_9ACTN|nr:hypothetical protein [Glycomyces luteolus]MDA1359418.1 hypothetical protein [Glycomyces luteolus]